MLPHKNHSLPNYYDKMPKSCLITAKRRNNESGTNMDATKPREMQFLNFRDEEKSVQPPSAGPATELGARETEGTKKRVHSGYPVIISKHDKPIRGPGEPHLYLGHGVTPRAFRRRTIELFHAISYGDECPKL